MVAENGSATADGSLIRRLGSPLRVFLDLVNWENRRSFQPAAPRGAETQLLTSLSLRQYRSRVNWNNNQSFDSGISLPRDQFSVEAVMSSFEWD